MDIRDGTDGYMDTCCVSVCVFLARDAETWGTSVGVGSIGLGLVFLKSPQHPCQILNFVVIFH